MPPLSRLRRPSPPARRKLCCCALCFATGVLSQPSSQKTAAACGRRRQKLARPGSPGAAAVRAAAVNRARMRLRRGACSQQHLALMSVYVCAACRFAPTRAPPLPRARACSTAPSRPRRAPRRPTGRPRPRRARYLQCVARFHVRFAAASMHLLLAWSPGRGVYAGNDTCRGVDARPLR